MKQNNTFFLAIAALWLVLYVSWGEYGLKTWNNINLGNFFICLLCYIRYQNQEGTKE